MFGKEIQLLLDAFFAPRVFARIILGVNAKRFYQLLFSIALNTFLLSSLSCHGESSFKMQN